MDEIMNYDEVMTSQNEVIEANGGNSGIGIGKAVLIGAGLTLATTAAIKLVKKAWAKHKAKKELCQADEDEFVDQTDDQNM